jgi:photoactive yellow protein
MEKFEYEGVDLAELLPRIPDNIKNDLPFGLVKLDMQGNILEYNMAEGQIAGVDASWAIGKNFFEEVAVCTKTAAFYGRFVEGVKKGFMNTVFDYTFDHRSNNARVRVHMVMVPDHLGRKNVMLMVRRADKPVVMDAFAPAMPSAVAPTAPTAVTTTAIPNAPAASAAQPAADESIQNIVAALIAALNAGGLPSDNSAPAASAHATHPNPTPIANPAPAAPASQRSGPKDIFEF